MGFMYATAPCFGCGNLFSFAPDLVPSIRVNAQNQPDPNGRREPICEACVERVNPRRVANGLEPIVVRPGAYEPQEVA